MLHSWRPPDDVAQLLRQLLNHGGFTSRSELISPIEQLIAIDSNRVVNRVLVDGLLAIADESPRDARKDVPAHADCYWENWLAHDGKLTALLDFEWARFGDPLDDYFTEPVPVSKSARILRQQRRAPGPCARGRCRPQRSKETSAGTTR